MENLINVQETEKGLIIQNNYDLNLFIENGRIYVSAKEVSEILSNKEELNPFCSLNSLNKPVFVDGVNTDILIDLLILDSTIIEKTNIISKKHNFKTYLILDNNTGYTKIGKSKNPKIREKTLQSEKPTIGLFAICNDNIESLLHKKYSCFNVRGEWYNLRESHIEEIIKNNNFLKYNL